jgi:cholest-4-en-3-one 26-monooxygenase
MAQANLTADSLERLDIVGPQAFADRGYPHEEWARLRRECPVYRYDRGDECTPFWAITKHADIVQVSRRPKILWNAPRLAVFPEGAPPEEPIARHLLNMDPPDHAVYRKLVSQHFTPRAVRRMEPEIERIARDRLDAIAREPEGSEIDFVEQVSAPIPLAVLADLLGVPRSDWKLMFRWTNEIVGSGDPEYQAEGADSRQTANRARRSLFEYFANMVEERRAQPREDIVSVLAAAHVEGAPIPPFELLSYYFLLVVAGNETTRNAMSGGLLALIEHPEQLAALRAHPELVDSAVEEILRWTTPVIQFCRTPTEPIEVRGQKIPPGDNLCLFYPSANRDEEVFDAPFEFRVDRDPNPHLAFGIGEHFCLGANLARLELRVLFRQLATRLQEVELVGRAERLRSSFLGGVKHLPIRCRLKPA